MEKKLLNRKTYKAIKRMDREKMESFIAIANVYHEGFKDGSEAGKKADFKIQLSEVLNKTKGIGLSYTIKLWKLQRRWEYDNTICRWVTNRDGANILWYFISINIS